MAEDADDSGSQIAQDYALRTHPTMRSGGSIMRTRRTTVA